MTWRAIYPTRARALLLPLCAVCLTSCAAAPKLGELKKAERNRAEIRALVDQQVVRADAKEIHLRAELLPEWSITHVALTPALFEEKLSTDKNRSYDHPYVYVHGRDVDWQCRYTASVPVFVRKHPASKDYGERQFFGFGRGECYQLVSTEKRLTAYVSLFNLDIDLGTELTSQRIVRNVDDAMDMMELKFYKALHNKTVESERLEASGITFAERAGYYERSVTFIHAALYAVPAERYYRLLLTGSRTITYLMITGPLSTSLEELQGYALPILKAVAFDK